MTKLKKILSSFVQKPKRAFLFFKEQINRGTLETRLRAFQRMLFSWNLCTNLYKLKLKDYISLTVDGNISSIKTIPLITPKWLIIDSIKKINDQYIELSDNAELKNKKEVNAKIFDISGKMAYLKLGISLLEAKSKLQSYQEVDFKNEFEYFKKFGIKFNTVEELYKKLVSTYKGFYIELTKLNKSQTKEKKETTTTRQDFSKTMAMLSKNGYKVDYSMSVSDWITTINLYRKECDDMEKQLKSIKNGK